jgi:Protein of unknown function (DUF2510)
MSGPANPIAGWYPDPSDPASSLRYWDGATWTDHTAPRFEPEPSYWDQQGSSPDYDEGAFAELDPGLWPTPPAGTPAVPAWQGGLGGPAVPGWRGGAGVQANQVWEGGSSTPTIPAWQGAAGTSARSPGSTAWQNGPVSPASPSAGGGGSPAWQQGAGAIYSSAPPQATKKSHTGLIVGAVILAVVVVIAGLVVVALPTYNGITGNTWFNGGVPGWPIIRVTNFPSNGATLLQAWKVPGPTVGPSKPFLQVARLKTGPAPDEMATQYLSATLQYLRTHGPGSGGLVTLDDGAPGLTWTRPTPLSNAPGLAITSFWLYAERGSSVYWIAFQTDTQDYASELLAVEPVMLKFKGTGH